MPALADLRHGVPFGVIIFSDEDESPACPLLGLAEKQMDPFQQRTLMKRLPVQVVLLSALHLLQPRWSLCLLTAVRGWSCCLAFAFGALQAAVLRLARQFFRFSEMSAKKHKPSHHPTRRSSNVLCSRTRYLCLFLYQGDLAFPTDGVSKKLKR